MDRFTIVPTDRNPRKSEIEKKIAYAWQAYNGDLLPPLKQRPNQPNDNVMVNTSRVVVDKGVSFLFGKGITWTLDGDQERSPNEKYLDDTWQHSGGDILLHKLAINGGITGHAFLKMRIEQPFIKLSVLDSANVRVITADNDYTEVLAYIITWSGRIDPKTGKQTHYRQIIQKMRVSFTADPVTLEVIEIPQHWLIIDQQTQSKDTNSEDVWVTISQETWNYEFAPIVDCQNMPSANRYWGTADLETDIIQLNESINRSLSNINRIIRNHAHPKTWSKGLTEQQIHQIVIDPDGMIHLPGELGSIQNLEMKSDLESSLNFYKELRTALYDLSRVPKIAFGNEENVNYLAAVAMQVLYGPLIEKTDVKRKTYGALIIEANRRILSIAGVGDTNICALVWPRVLPKDSLVEAQTAILEEQAGVSMDTTIEKLGYDPDLERTRRKRDMTERVMEQALLAKAMPKPAGSTQSNA